ncbi:hypothetical protein [Saccharothrix xinjiangensis]|uniref:Uncharacterized protein n=1 Tax=Saccharothrix xinjiangensis TaxID=204798 RepID=A0ABV9Y7I9_9PSEU
MRDTGYRALHAQALGPAHTALRGGPRRGLPAGGQGQPDREALREHRVEEDVPGARLAAGDQVETSGFRPPARLLAMSGLPDLFRPEPADADLCRRATGVPPPPPATGTSPPDPDLGRARAPGEPEPLDLSLTAARARHDQGDHVPRGSRWAAGELARWCDELARETTGFPARTGCPLLVHLPVPPPVALPVRLSADPLRRRRTSASYWYESTPATRGALRP